MIEVPAQEFAVSDEDQASILAEMGRLLAAGRFSGGENVRRLEEEFAAYVGAAHAVAVSSGTTGLEVSFQALGVKGREVIVPANTNFATFVAAARAGADVVLADVDQTTLAPSVADLEKVSTRRTAAVALVHMGGLITPAVHEITSWAAQQGIALVEDTAHAHGSWRDGRHAGTFGVAGVFSFFATKVMTTGEGGMVVTDDAELAQETRVLRNLGKTEAWVSRHIRASGNGRMTEFSAVVGRHQLRHLDDWVAARRRIAARYHSLLPGPSGVSVLLPDHPYSGYKVIAWLPPGVAREHLKRDLAAAGIHLPGEVYAEPLHHQPVLAKEYGHLSLPGAERACAQQICLPVYPTLDSGRVEVVADAVLSLVGAA